MYTPTSAGPKSFLLSKIESLKARAELLGGLSKVVATNNNANISNDQWAVINSQLTTVSNKIVNQLNNQINKYYQGSFDKTARHSLINALGEIEMEMSEAYGFYDTFMDILTQRLSPVLGPLLRGCDVIAEDGLMHQNLELLAQKPIVYCDRGFGASILREGVSISRTTNPISFIAIPYSRLAEKYNLISIYHEVGHLALNKINLVETFQAVFAEAVKNAGGNKMMQNLFANWSKEIVPDYWAFMHTGMAQTSSMRDVLLVPKNMAFQVSPYQQHPPSYLRFLLSVEWCRYLWGRGEWDAWVDEWNSFYPLQDEDQLTQETILIARKLLPVVCRAVITAKFKILNRKPLTSLFRIDNIEPAKLRECSCSINNLGNQPIGVQLAAFRLLRDKSSMPINQLNDMMHSWLMTLNN